MADVGDDLIDYEEEEIQVIGGQDEVSAPKSTKDLKKGSYVGIHSTGFRDFLLKPELLRAIADCGFEHPSEGMHLLIPSPTRMYPTSHSWHRCYLSSKKWNG